MERKIHANVFKLIDSIGRFFTTYRSFSLHPKKSFSIFFSSPKKVFTQPGTFLLINIFLSYTIANSIGYTLSPLPLQIPFLTKLSDNYLLPIFKYALGFSLFLAILRWRFNYKDTKHFIDMVLPILCYTSIVYIPFVIVKHYYFDFMSQDYMQIISTLMNGLIPNNFSLIILKYLLIPPLTFLTLTAWWLSLIHIGMTNLKMKITKRGNKLIIAYLVFVSLQITFSFTATIITNWSTLSATKTLILRKAQKEYNKIPPNYLGAVTYATIISGNEEMPLFIRYIFQLRKISYILASPIYEADTTLIRQILNHIDLKDVESAQNLLNNHIHKHLSNDKTDPKWLFIQNELATAESLFQSPQFVNLGKEAQIGIGFLFGGKPLPISTLHGDKTYHILIEFQPSCIALFP